MNYMTIKENDIANGEGVRVSLFVSGCNKHCPGCFNKEAWPYDAGKPFTYNTLIHLLDLVDRSYIQGLSILGGEPFDPANIGMVSTIVNLFRLRFENTKDLWIYTGNTWASDDVYRWINIAAKADVIVDGQFEEDKKDPSLWFKGSANQNIIDVKKTFENNYITLWKPKEENK